MARRLTALLALAALLTASAAAKDKKKARNLLSSGERQKAVLIYFLSLGNTHKVYGMSFYLFPKDEIPAGLKKIFDEV